MFPPLLFHVTSLCLYLLFMAETQEMVDCAPCRVNPPTGRPNVRVLLHHVHGLLDSLGLEVHVAVQRQTEGPPGGEIFPASRLAESFIVVKYFHGAAGQALF